MGMRPSVTVFYGIDYGLSLDADQVLVMEKLAEHTGSGVEAVPYGHADLTRWGLATTRSLDRGGSYQPVELPDREVYDGSDDILELSDFCKANGLPWKEPKWWAVPYYG